MYILELRIAYGYLGHAKIIVLYTNTKRNAKQLCYTILLEWYKTFLRGLKKTGIQDTETLVGRTILQYFSILQMSFN